MNARRFKDFVRGFGFGVVTLRGGWLTGTHRPGIGKEWKESLRQPGPWLVAVTSFGEMLPYAQNRITLHSSKRDRWGIPLVDIDCSYQSNELKMLEAMNADAKDMMDAAGYRLCRAVSRAVEVAVRAVVAPIPGRPVVATAGADQPLRSALLLSASVSHRGPPVSCAR